MQLTNILLIQKHIIVPSLKKNYILKKYESIDTHKNNKIKTNLNNVLAIIDNEVRL